MKIIWEEADIKVGRKVKRPNVAEENIIGFRAERADDRYVLVSLIDGNVSRPISKSDMAKSLNANNYWPLEMLEET